MPIMRPVLLFKGRHRRRAEDGAAVRRKAGDAVLSSHRVGPKGPADAAPAGGARNPSPREALASRPPALRPAARSSTERWAARGGDEGAVATAPDRGLEHGPCRYPEYGPKGLQERRINSPDCASLSGCGAPGGASSRSQGMRRRLTASRAASPAAQGASQAPAFPGAPLPLREPRFGLRDEGLPGADQRARAMAHGRLKSESARCARQTFLASRGAREASREG